MNLAVITVKSQRQLKEAGVPSLGRPLIGRVFQRVGIRSRNVDVDRLVVLIGQCEGVNESSESQKCTENGEDDPEGEDRRWPWRTTLRCC